MFPQTPKLYFILFSLVMVSFVQIAKSDIQPSVIQLPTDFAGNAKLCSPEDSSAKSCPLKCFRPDPVCGENGVTYWCGCADAHCAGTRVAKLGYCEVGSGGSGPLSGQALLLVHIIFLIVIGFSVLCGLL